MDQPASDHLEAQHTSSKLVTLANKGSRRSRSMCYGEPINRPATPETIPLKKDGPVFDTTLIIDPSEGTVTSSRANDRAIAAEAWVLTPPLDDPFTSTIQTVSRDGWYLPVPKRKVKPIYSTNAGAKSTEPKAVNVTVTKPSEEVRVRHPSKPLSHLTLLDQFHSLFPGFDVRVRFHDDPDTCIATSGKTNERCTQSRDASILCQSTRETVQRLLERMEKVHVVKTQSLCVQLILDTFIDLTTCRGVHREEYHRDIKLFADRGAPTGAGILHEPSLSGISPSTTPRKRPRIVASFGDDDDEQTLMGSEDNHQKYRQSASDHALRLGEVKPASPADLKGDKNTLEETPLTKKHDRYLSRGNASALEELKCPKHASIADESSTCENTLVTDYQSEEEVWEDAEKVHQSCDVSPSSSDTKNKRESANTIVHNNALPIVNRSTAFDRFNKIFGNAFDRFTENKRKCVGEKQRGGRCGNPITSTDGPFIQALFSELQSLLVARDSIECANQMGKLADLAFCKRTHRKKAREEIRMGLQESTLQEHGSSILSEVVRDGVSDINIEPENRILTKSRDVIPDHIKEDIQKCPTPSTNCQGTPRASYVPKFIAYQPQGLTKLSAAEATFKQATKDLTKLELKEGYLYVYWNGSCFGARKIGFSTKDPRQRLKKWESDCGHIAQPFYIAPHPVPNVKRLENIVHTELKELRVREQKCPGCHSNHREWFRDLDDGVLHATVEKWSAWIQKSPYDLTTGKLKAEPKRELKEICDEIAEPEPRSVQTRPRRSGRIAARTANVNGHVSPRRSQRLASQSGS